MAAALLAGAVAAMGEACEAVREASQVEMAAVERPSVFSVRLGTSDEAAAIKVHASKHAMGGYANSRRFVSRLAATAASVGIGSELGETSGSATSAGGASSADRLPESLAGKVRAVRAALQQAAILASAHGLDRGPVSTASAAAAGVTAGLREAHASLAPYATADAASVTVASRVEAARADLSAHRTASEAEAEALERAASQARELLDEARAVLAARKAEAQDAAAGDVEALADAARRRRGEALEQAAVVTEALERASEALRDARSLMRGRAPAAGAAAGSAGAGASGKRPRLAAGSRAGEGPASSKALAERDQLRAEAGALAAMLAASKGGGAAEAKAREEKKLRVEAETDAAAAAAAEAEGKQLEETAAWFASRVACVVDAAAASGGQRAVLLRVLREAGGELAHEDLSSLACAAGLEEREVTRQVYQLAASRFVSMDRVDGGMVIRALVIAAAVARRAAPAAERRLASSKSGGGTKKAAAKAEPAAKPATAAADAASSEASSAAGPGGAGPTAKVSQASNRGPVSWPSLMLLLGVGVGVLGYFQYERQRRKAIAGRKTTGTGRPLLGGPYSLVDHHGRPFGSKDLEGQYSLLYFGFTYCPDICPNELVKMGQVIDMLDKQKDLPAVQPVLISVDPHRDTVAQMRAYVEDFHPRMVGLTGTPDQVGRAAKAFRVFFQEVDREEDDDDYLVDHSIVMYLMDPQGKLVDFFPQLVEPQEISERIAGHIRSELGLDRWDPAGLFARMFGGGKATSTRAKVPLAAAPKDE
ncbi:hypothetical protein FNF29_00480 [Cafeteria roenbergensis]|uniref:Thioredoxin domain-containing protein n=1 Tax=Cafeteria roenbergensis TaxID=33653 RepID=A0A5A8CWK3_CAFRO|nr:hypothetical protein FNF29_00480 [Cafeteria roenbergensis]|eukprot:KAA0157128.1 hypothetical protein FNF29_00480 [Cafeteria roenbergensis]